MLGKLTYAVLHKLLTSLGFNPKPVRRSWQAYHHRASDALILLRKRRPTANVSEPDILSIRRHLVEKGLIDENEFDQLLSEAA